MPGVTSGTGVGVDVLPRVDTVLARFFLEIEGDRFEKIIEHNLSLFQFLFFNFLYHSHLPLCVVMIFDDFNIFEVLCNRLQIRVFLKIKTECLTCAFSDSVESVKL